MKVTHASVEELARKRWPNARVIELEHAPTKAQREAQIKIQREISPRIKSIDAEIKALGHRTPMLVKAARLVVETDGDKTAIKELRDALEPAERLYALWDERKVLIAKWEGFPIGMKRWTVARSVGPYGVEHPCDGDTLEELADAIMGITTVSQDGREFYAMGKGLIFSATNRVPDGDMEAAAEARREFEAHMLATDQRWVYEGGA